MKATRIANISSSKSESDHAVGSLQGVVALNLGQWKTNTARVDKGRLE